MALEVLEYSEYSEYIFFYDTSMVPFFLILGA